jgi:uncharacterized protein YukJ
MPVPNYGVLKGKAVGKDRGKPGDKTPHFEIHVTAGQKHYRVAVNVESKQAPSEVLYLAEEHFNWASFPELNALSAGFTLLDGRDTIAMDYVRSGLFDTRAMKPLPPNVPGENNDLEDLVEKYVKLAISSPAAMVYAFGSRFGPQKGKDPSFGFSPQLGVHDIDMNQGNSKDFVDQDGVFQYLAFQSQSFQTDDRTGHREEAAAAAVAGGSVAAAGAAKEGPGRIKRRTRR